MRTSTVLFAIMNLVFPSLLGALPASSVTPQQCQAVNQVLSVLHLLPQATPVCSSFLHIPTSTVTATVTVSSISTVGIVTTTGTLTNTAQPVTATATSTVSVTQCPGGNAIADGGSPGGNAVADGAIAAKRAVLATSSTSPLPSAMAPFPTPQISTACSCLSIPTPTVTVQTTTTVKGTKTSVTANVAATATITPTTTTTILSTYTVASCSTSSITPTPTPTDCNNGGLQYALYANSERSININPAAYNGKQPITYGVTPYLGFNYPAADDPNSPQQVYSTALGGSSGLLNTYFVLNHQGYLYASQTGTYTFANIVADDAVWFWIGQQAVSGWNSGNANYQLQGGFAPPYGSFTVDLVAGTYTPFRVVYDNASNGGSLQVDIRAPDGSYVEVSPGPFGTRPSSPFTQAGFFQQYSCDYVFTGSGTPLGLWWVA